MQVLRPDGGFQQVLRGQATLPKWAEEFFAANPDEMKERMESNLLPLMVSSVMSAVRTGHGKVTVATHRASALRIHGRRGARPCAPTGAPDNEQLLESLSNHRARTTISGLSP